jgi:hypothetical protein
MSVVIVILVFLLLVYAKFILEEIDREGDK